MSAEERVAGAAGSGLLPDADMCQVLLDTVVEAAREAFGAAACSITLLDEATDELVFAAAAGEGSEGLLGDRFPAGAGIAGWVLTSQQPLAVDEVRADPRFARDVAERTGYIPTTIMAAPVLRGEAALGVLSVLDRQKDALPELAAAELLARFAAQAAVASEIVERIRHARAVAGGGDTELAVVARLAGSLAQLEGRRRDDALELLSALERVLTRA